MTNTSTPLTPMLRQYHELKRQHPGTLLFFRLGDFYELFFEDAVAGYVARLIRKGYRVAICEQTEDPSKAKKLVRREVVRVITPGTAVDPHLVEAKECVSLAAVCGAGDTYGAAFLDLSTGDFRCTEVTGPDAWARVRSDIESYAPRRPRSRPRRRRPRRSPPSRASCRPGSPRQKARACRSHPWTTGSGSRPP